MYKTLILCCLSLFLILSFSCEKIELTDNPGPWILLEKPYSAGGRYILSEDTVVKRLNQNTPYWIGEVAVHSFAANGLKELSIKVNGMDYQLYGDYSPEEDLYAFLQYVDIRVDAVDSICLIDVKAVDYKDLIATKTIKVRYSNKWY